MTRGLAFTTATAALLLAATAATGSSLPPSDPGGYTLTYQISGETVFTDSDGNQKVDALDSQPVVVRCAVDWRQCEVIDGGSVVYYFGGVEIALDGRPQTWQTGDTASVCDEGILFGTMTFTADATGITTVQDTPTTGWEDCADGRTYQQARVISASGGPPAGDLCIFNEGACAREAPPEPSPNVIASLDSSELGSGNPAAPSVLSALAAPEQVAADLSPARLALTAALTVVLVLLVAFPTALLNSAVDTGVDRFSTWLRQRRVARPASGASRSWTSTWWWAACGVAAAALISAFVDPQFGFNPGSVRMLLSLLVGFALDVVLGWFLVIWLAKRLIPDARHSFSFTPITLLVVIAAVLFTRITGFEPGIVFGLVAGVSFGALVSKAQSARVVLLPLGFALLLGVLAWLGYGLIPASDSFWPTFLQETLASVAIGGMAALPIALVPLRGLAGHTIWQWSRWAWAGCYAVGLMAFFTVLMPMPFSWSEVSLDLVSWLVIYVAYALIAVVLWLVSAYARRSRAQSATPPE